MKLKLNSVAFFSVLAFFISMVSSGSALAQTTCPTGNNTLIVNQQSAVNNGLDVLFNDMQGNMITLQSVNWKAELWFNYIDAGKANHMIADGPSESEPGSNQVIITLSNPSGSQVYYSSMVMGAGSVSTCKDAKGVITVSFGNVVLTSKSELQTRISGFATYSPAK